MAPDLFFSLSSLNLLPPCQCLHNPGASFLTVALLLAASSPPLCMERRAACILQEVPAGTHFLLTCSQTSAPTGLPVPGLALPSPLRTC